MDRDELREAIARSIFDTRDNAYDMDEWEDLDEQGRERWECYADAALRVIEHQNGGA